MVGKVAAVFRIVFLFFIFTDFKCSKSPLFAVPTPTSKTVNHHGSASSCSPIPIEAYAIAAVEQTRPSSGLKNVNIVWLWSRPVGTTPFRPDGASRRSVFIELLLLTDGDVESNHGLVGPCNCVSSIKFGSLNCRSAVNKAVAIHTIIVDHQLDVLSLQET